MRSPVAVRFSQSQQQVSGCFGSELRILMMSAS